MRSGRPEDGEVSVTDYLVWAFVTVTGTLA